MTVSVTSGNVGRSKPRGIDFLGGVFYKYSMKLFSVGVTVSEFTDGSKTSEIISRPTRVSTVLGFWGKMTPLENCRC
jgi:hypothetical protein